VGPLPMFLFILLIQPVALGFVRRRNEFRADQFAADLVGDSEVMVSALMKMAYENQGPTDLKRMDEFLASHPSISKRVAALRSFGQGTVSQPN
jgi:Zn-dependent protease with chaperone function